MVGQTYPAEELVCVCALAVLLMAAENAADMKILAVVNVRAVPSVKAPTRDALLLDVLVALTCNGSAKESAENAEFSLHVRNMSPGGG